MRKVLIVREVDIRRKAFGLAVCMPHSAAT
jgi:hypothetical protein